MASDIDEFSPDSPAEKAGLKIGDVLLKVDGAAITGCDEARRRVGRQEAGRHGEDRRPPRWKRS